MLRIPYVHGQYTKIAYWVICIFALLDAWNFASSKILLSSAAFLKASSGIRLLFEALIIAILWKRKFICSRISGKLLLISASLFVSSLVGFVIFQSKFPREIPFSNFMICFNKYVFFFLCYFFFQNTQVRSSKADYARVFQLYESIILANTAFAFIGYIGDIWWLRAYDDGLRWGYHGMFTFGVEATFFNVLALLYGYVTWRTEKRKIPYLLALISCLLSGAKASWALMIVISFWMLLKAYPRLGVAAIALGTASLFAIHEILIDALSQISAVAFFFDLYARGYPIEKIIFSSRNELVMQALVNMQYWTNLNVLFGGGGLVTWGIGLPKGEVFQTEMDFLDLLLFFGFLGSTIFLYGYALIFKDIDKSYRYFIMACVAILAGLSGHVFYSSMNAIYFVLLIQKSQSPLTTTKAPQHA